MATGSEVALFREPWVGFDLSVQGTWCDGRCQSQGFPRVLAGLGSLGVSEGARPLKSNSVPRTGLPQAVRWIGCKGRERRPELALA
jgi:hypothetical protein